MDKLVTSRSGRWKVFGTVLLIICIAGVIKGFISERNSSSNAQSARNPTTVDQQKVHISAKPQQDAGSTFDSWLANNRKQNTTKLPDTLPENFSDWDPPAPKTLSACQAKISEWQRWYENNIAVFENLKTGNDQLRQENSELDADNSRLRNQLRISEPVGVFVALLGVGAGIAVIFILGKLLRRIQWPALKLSREKKKLLLLIGGAVWVSVVVVICSQEQILYLHPINLLVAVVVYSIPVVLFDGIAFWWLRDPKKT